MAVYKKGSKGSGVKDLQKKLNKNKAKPKVEEDGAFGGGTETAVKAFQKSKKLKADGIAGPNTLAALNGKAPADEKSKSEDKGGKSSSGGGKPAKWTHPDYQNMAKKELKDYDSLNREIAKTLGKAPGTIDEAKECESIRKDWDKEFFAWKRLVRELTVKHGQFKSLEKADPSQASSVCKQVDKKVSTERKHFKKLESLEKDWGRASKNLAKVI